jgi:cell division protein FtsN
MKKILFVAAALCTVFMFDSCKSKEDLYKTAYDEARQKEAEGQAQQNEFVEIAPVASTTKEVKEVDESYRTEKVVLSEGAEGSLKAYSVVCGSFGVKANADNLRKSLLGEGYNAIVVQNPATGMYRVVCASYDSRQEAAQARAQFKAAHPDNSDFQKAWLLYNK